MYTKKYIQLIIAIIISHTLILVCAENKTVIKVKWYVDDIRETFGQISDKRIRDENRRRCAGFGLNDRKGCFLGVANIRVGYEDEKYNTFFDQFKNIQQHRKLDWVFLVPTCVLEKNNSKLLSKPTIRSVCGQVEQALTKTTVNFQKDLLSYTDSSIYGLIASTLLTNAIFFQQSTKEYAHPRYIPAGWIVDKGVGDKICYEAHGFTIEATIESMPHSGNTRTFLKLLSWQKYLYDNRNTIGKGLAILALIWLVKR